MSDFREGTKCRITHEQHTKLVEAYLDVPAGHANAARLAGVSTHTAIRAWKEGWDFPAWASTPIKQVVLQKQIEARALLQDADRERKLAKEAAKRRKGRKLAGLDAAEEKAREATAVRAAMTNAMGLLGITAELSKNALPAIQRAVHRLSATEQVSWKQAVKLTSDLSWIANRTHATLKMSMEMLRMHLGEPDKILSVVGETGQQAKIEAEATIAAMGSEGRFRKGVQDLLDGNMTEEALQLIEIQGASQDGLH